MPQRYLLESTTFQFQKPVLSALTAVPLTPATGDRHLLTAAPNANSIAMWLGTAWQYTTPKTGMVVYNVATGKFGVYGGSAWDFSYYFDPSNKVLLATYTQTDANLADAVAKKHDGTAQDTAIADKIPLGQKGAASGVATLGADSKIPTAQLPAIAITDTFVVASEAAMLALVAETGDVAIRTDLSKSFILAALPATTLANWKELLSPSAPTLAGDVTGPITSNTVALVGGKTAALVADAVDKRLSYNAALELFEVTI